MFFRRTTTFGLLALVGPLLNGCGESGAPQPTQAQTPTASPTPTPPRDAGFLHVLSRYPSQGDASLVTYRIDAASGRLTVSSTQQLSNPGAQVSGEPLGRYVYIAFDTRDYSHSEPDPWIVSYAPDAHDGTLTAISETSTAAPAWFLPGYSGWRSIRAGVDRVHGSFEGDHPHSSPYEYGHVSAASDDGRLGPAYFHDFADGSGADGMIDARAGVVYSTRDAYNEGALHAHAVTANGRLRRTGTSSSCGKWAIDLSRPLASARGFVFATAWLEKNKWGVCSWEGPGLTPRAAALLLYAYTAEAFIPSDDAEPVQLAVSASGELRLYAMGGDGSLQLQEAVVTPRYADRLLFHPAGRFLFANVGADLLVYSFTPRGSLELVDQVSRGAGPMAVTTPRGGAAAASPPDGL